MSEQDYLLIPAPPPREPTQPALHPKEQKRATIALWVAGVAAAFALIAALGAIWQAVEAHHARIDASKAFQDQAKDVERSRKAAEDSAKATNILAEANTKSATIAGNALDIAKNQLHLQQDALIAQQRPILEITKDEPGTTFIRATLSNSGHSGALHVIVVYHVDLVIVRNSRIIVQHTLPWNYSTVGKDVFPDKPQCAYISVPADEEIHKVYPQYSPPTMHSREWGTITYEDVFGRRFDLHYCYISQNLQQFPYFDCTSLNRAIHK